MKKRARIVSGLAALAALFLAPVVEASITRPSAPPRETPALSLTLAAPEPSEFSLFDGTEIARALVSRPAFDLISITTDETPTTARTRFVSPSELSANELPNDAPELVPITSVREQRFNLQIPPNVFGLEPLRGPPGDEASYAKTRYRVFGLLGTPLLGELRGVSLELHWGSASFSAELASGTVGWLSQDPLGDKDSPNLYGFVGARPHEKTDPLGLCLGLDNVPCLDYLAEVPQFLGDVAVDAAKAGANVATVGGYGGYQRAKARGELDAGGLAGGKAYAKGVANFLTIGWYDTAEDTVEAGGTLGQATKTWAGQASGYTDIAEGGTKLGEGEYIEGAGRIVVGTGKIAGWIVGARAGYAKATNQPLMAFGKNLGGSGTYRDANGRLHDAKTNCFVTDPETPPPAPNPSIHGNAKTSSLPATLYGKFDKNGRFLKWGITDDPAARYSKAELDGGFLKEYRVGPREDILVQERRLVERFPGPENNEPWAGWRNPSHANYRGP